MEKKTYEKPEICKVDFKFEEVVAASTCEFDDMSDTPGVVGCMN